MRWGAFATAFLVVVALAGPLGAQTTDRDRADALFRAGRTAAQAGDYATACAKFTESQRLDPSTGTLLNLGDCAEQQGQWVAARNYFEDAVAQLGAGDPRVKPAKERLAALDARLPRLAIALAPDAPPGTTVRRDGRVVPDAELDAPMPLDPGEHVITVVVPGRPEEQRHVVLREAQSERVVVGAKEAPSTTPSNAVTPLPQAAPAEERSSARTAGWIVGGVGVAGFVMAGVSGVVLINEKSTADNGCHNKMDCSPDALSAIASNKSWLVVNAVAWVIGVAGVASGAYLILSHREPRPTARVGVAVGPNGAVANATVEF
jgi:hypothetical protein